MNIQLNTTYDFRVDNFLSFTNRDIFFKKDGKNWKIH